MRFQKSRLGLKLVAVYIISVISAFIFLLLNIEKDVFAYFFVMIVTTPWSYLEAIIWTFLNVTDLIPESIKIATFIFYAFINTFILYCLVTKSEKKVLEIIIEEPTEFYDKPFDQEPFDILHIGEMARVIHSRYFKGLKFLKIKLKD